MGEWKHATIGDSQITKHKLLLVGPEPITLSRDKDMLCDRFSVKVIHFAHRSTSGYVTDVINILRGVFWCDVSVAHFAGQHSIWTVLFSRMLRKKSVVIVAGYEVAKEEAISYGLMLNTRKAWVLKKILQTADRVLAVSAFTRSEILRYIPDLNVSVTYGCNSVDPSHFIPGRDKQRIVITVGVISDEYVKRKGFETFIEAARIMPELKFMLLGKFVDGNTVNHLRTTIPENLIIENDEDLLAWYQRAAVYCQLSYYESFGVCVIEAMSCQCVPVVTDKGALPEVVGDAGFYVPYGDVAATVTAIRNALESDIGMAARDRVLNRFSFKTQSGSFADEIAVALEL